MANSQQAKKRVRQAARSTAANMPIRTRVRTWIKRVKSAIEKGDAATAQAHFLVTQKEIDKACQKGILEKNTASRYKSRLNARIKALKESA